MSPLARSLLALACAALFHASSADWDQRVRAELPDWDSNLNNCGELELGIENDKHAKETRLNPIYVPPNTLLKIPNVAKPDEALEGQHLFVCDPTGLAKKVTLKPVTKGAHSPIKVQCKPKGACPKGVVAFTNQYVIKQLL